LLPLDKFNTVRKRTDAKINTIVSSCVFRALRRYSNEIAKLTPGYESTMTHNTCWTISCAQSLWIPGDEVEMTNKATILPYTCSEDDLRSEDPLESLQRVKQTVEEQSRNAYSWSLGCLMKVVLNTVPVTLSDQIMSPLVRTTGVFTNIRGPTEQQTCLGHKVTSMQGYVSMWENIGELSLSLSRYPFSLVFSRLQPWLDS
jgi:hypothetical protein